MMCRYIVSAALLLLILEFGSSRVARLCPSLCSCSSDGVVDCKGRNIHMVPTVFPDNAKRIDLSKNLISEIPAEAFGSLPNLESIDLRNNRVTSIEATAFSGSSNLTELLLSSNQLQTIHTSTFYDIPNLQVLDISQNRLNEIPVIRDVRSLRYLYLAGNQFSRFMFGTSYRRATNLTRITLSNNPKVTSIKSGDFAGLAQTVSIRRLSLSRCGISTVEPGSFKPFARELASLDLSLNKKINSSTLQTILADFNNSKTLVSLDLGAMGLDGYINASTFRVLGNNSKLSTLHISDNQIKGIDDGAFDLLKMLKYLTIANTGLMKQPHLANNDQLITLDMSDNSLTSLYETRFPHGLTTLILDNNRLGVLRSRVFSRLSSLTKLTLTGNKINNLESRCLEGLGKLQTLDLSGNLINGLPNGVFTALGSLLKFDLSKNDIQYINATGNQTFLPMKRLSTLDLSENSIRSFNPTLFHYMKSLKVLSLNHNHLGKGFDDDNLNYRGFLSDLEGLQVVNLSSNGINVLPAAMIANTPRLETIDLSANNIYSWDSQHVFSGSQGLKHLLLSSNRLALFNSTSFTDLKNLTVLDLTNNPFACTCDMRWFRDWLKSTKVHVNGSHSYTCASPGTLQGTHVMDYDLSYLQCLPQWIWITSGCVLSGIIILILILVLYRYRWRIRFRWYKCRQSCCISKSAGRNNRLLSEDQRNRYAAFLSHCSHNECMDIIERDILPNIDNNMPDSHAGIYPIIHRGIYELDKTNLWNFDEAMNLSPATVVVLCSHYKSDMRCEMELITSLTMKQEEGREIIILLLDPSIKPARIPSALRMLLISNESVIEWSRTEQQACLDMLKGKLARAWTVASASSDDRDSVVYED